MSDLDVPQINISTRPYLGDVLSAPPAPVTPRPQENAQLWQALGASEPTPTPSQTRSQNAGRSTSHENKLGPISGYLDVDWSIVETLAKKLELTDEGNETRREFTDFDVAWAPGHAETPYEALQWQNIEAVVTREAKYRTVQHGADHSWGPLTRAHYVQAVFDKTFRYGPLQQYLREPEVEDISVVGHENVVVTKSNGRKERRPAIARTEKELEDLVIALAEARGRSFARGIGHLDLDLGGARLAVVGSTIATMTSFTVRKHNMVDIDMETLVTAGTISGKISEFMAAASAANACVLVAGFPTAGKTTFLRALASAIPFDEKIITIETERELYLEKLPHRHSQVLPLQELPSQFASGDAKGGFSLEDGFSNAVRQGAERLFFAEIRAKEGPIALKAMQAGKGAMSTIHARSADDAIHRFADVLMSEYKLSDDTVPLRQILRTIDLIVYIDFLTLPDGTRRRVVTEVAEIVPTSNASGAPMASRLFEYDWETGRYTQPNQPTPQLMRSLNRVGYTTGNFNSQRGAS